jgi:NTP pyrophosphatase (non-canonical NTP hydrolase)
MNLADLQKLGADVDDAYASLGKEKGYKERTPYAYCGFLATDLGELTEFVMAKENYRDGEDLDRKIAHELSDCLWAVLMLARHLDVNMEEAYVHTMEEIKKRQELGTAG